ncbi:MAG: glycolate oxidase subunit GlcE, partial [Burkholderiales bacterium]|nr:glycolate oxidase subunit GlcE [Burkholderiales bacterium]
RSANNASPRFTPRPAALASIEQRLQHSFDPARIFNRGAW